MSATLPPTLWAPGRRAKGSATSSNGEELAGEEVLELRLFADKKVWIEEKIQFLSSLPPVEVTTPEPPARSPVSHKELDAWWTEHDRIEREIQAYDMGDLTKMRNIARERSKQELSPRDTDLIELTLTTLFAVDKLLSLLRQRRKALTRLDYRLKWEEATASAWQFRQRLLADLPTFLAKARWRPTPIGDSTLPRSASSSLAPTSHKTRSSSSTSFASSPSSQDLPTLSASASSSTLRASSTTTNLLSLSLAALTTQSRTLSSSAVPLSASFLDKLIDSSITPLPESFLDEQDRLEDSVKAISEGLHRFAEQLVGQRSAADHLFQGLSIAVTTARTLESDIRTAQAELPSVASDFASRLLSLERDLDDLRADLRNLPRPLHPSAPDQSAHNSELVATLQQRLRDAGEAARAAEAAVARCAADRRAVQSAQAVRTDLLRLSKELSTFRWNIEAIITRPAGLRDGLAVLDASDAGAAFEYEWDGLAERIAVAVEQAESVSKDTARCVVELADRKICSSLRKEVRDAAADVRGLRQSVVELLDAEARRRKEVSAVRAASRTIEDAARRVTVVKQELCEAGEDSKWRESRMAPVEAEDVKVAVSQVRAEVDSLFATRVVPVLASLDDLQLVTLRQNLLERSDTVIDRIRGLDTLASQVDGLRRQSRSIQAFVEEVEVVTTELRGLLHELDAVVAGPADALPGDAEIGPMCDRLEGCAETVKALVDNVATSIFLLAPASPPSSTHGSDDLLQLAEQDDHVRIFVNNTCARLRALVDEAQRSTDVLAIMQKARRWDADCLEAERRVEVLAQEIGRVGYVLETGPSTTALGAPEADALTQADSAEPALQDSSAAPPTATLALGPENDTALDLFTFDPPSDEPAAFSDLRRHVQRIATADWLSPTLLVLPSTADAASLDGELATCRGELAALAEGSDETLVWADFPSLEREIEDKDKQVRRVAALARFADFLARADATLSDL
ncbi:growth-arrest-specific protein 2 domain containing protein [Rhodotorula toruloides]|uniref:Growth-arrest-specific protein 2 domain containing protein n=1 Tax=Rhodotorula toruloides TaxID=5286 RepID=A0A511KDF2_RHOTO|nr:growth-arrest-specific protein 2 domain containing protein [Rhodotorula toruloides]